jgi:hypothetical protein
MKVRKRCPQQYYVSTGPRYISNKIYVFPLRDPYLVRMWAELISFRTEASGEIL